jgi:hypothetical protein
MRPLIRTRRFVPALLLAVLSCLAAATPALALDFNPADYFRLTYDPITYDRSQVAPGETFHTTIKGVAACDQDIPLPVSRATVDSRVIARRTGAEYVLNPGFSVEIDPFPRRAGETFEINVPLELRFPSPAAPGDYEVIGQIVEARARVTFIWTDVSDYFPAEQSMGRITVISPRPGATTPPPPTTITTSRQPPPGGVPLWVLPLGALVVIAIIVTGIVWLIRRRR